jgi:cysteinyl-tRNA synthetase
MQVEFFMLQKRVITALMLLLLLGSCSPEMDTVTPVSSFYKKEMKALVIHISRYARIQKPGFSIVPQNGIELVTLTGEETSAPDTAYLNAIDGNGQEDLLYGYNKDNQPSPASETEYLKNYLNLSKAAGNTILVTDYCSDKSKMENSYVRNHASGYLSFAADHRELDDIPNFPLQLPNQNQEDIYRLSQAKNFLYLINPQNFATKAAFLSAMKATNYDVIIMDMFFNDGKAFTAGDIGQLKTKDNGGRRLVFCYLSIGEAEDYRYYWNPDWKKHPPAWLAGENPDWPGNYKVKYWDPQWQAILYGNDSSYLHKILAAGFDGAYLDIVDAFEYFEGNE